MRILVIEDEKKVASFIKKGLQQEGYAADTAYDGAEATHMVAAFDYDLAILDLMLPKRPGLEVLREIRLKKPKLPVLVLTAKGAVDDKVAGLDAGADDYLIKPFAFAELSARIRALLRRGAQETPKLRIADLEMDTASRQVRRAGQPIDLKLKEYALLEFLLRNAHRPVTRTMIVEHVWDIHFDSISNVVDVHINSLRNKIDRGFEPQLIHTIRGVGYMLSDRKGA
jgi:two-component system, OmpR family, copper resistance phosphate regulon response regulator CusR